MPMKRFKPEQIVTLLRQIEVEIANGKTTSDAYDDADRLTSVTDAAQHTTYYQYDTEDDLTSITGAKSNVITFTYDAFGRVTKTTFPSALSEGLSVDAGSRQALNEVGNRRHDGLVQSVETDVDSTRPHTCR